MTTQKIKEKIAHLQSMLAAKENLGKTKEWEEMTNKERLLSHFENQVEFIKSIDFDIKNFDLSYCNTEKDSYELKLEINYRDKIEEIAYVKENMTAKDFMNKYPGLTENWD